jgi:hypothetical protein
MSTLTPESKGSKATIIEEAISCVESIANAAELLRRDIEGTCEDAQGRDDKTPVSTLENILNTGDKRIFEHCDRIDNELIEIQELLFGKILLDLREKRIEGADLTKPTKLCSALLQFEDVVASIRELGKFIFDRSSGNFPVNESSDLESSNAVSAEASLDGILTELPKELSRLCDIALTVFNQMRIALF